VQADDLTARRILVEYALRAVALRRRDVVPAVSERILIAASTRVLFARNCRTCGELVPRDLIGIVDHTAGLGHVVTATEQRIGDSTIAASAGVLVTRGTQILTQDSLGPGYLRRVIDDALRFRHVVSATKKRISETTIAAGADVFGATAAGLYSLASLALKPSQLVGR
jgi:hypothetical protein